MSSLQNENPSSIRHKCICPNPSAHLQHADQPWVGASPPLSCLAGNCHLRFALLASCEITSLYAQNVNVQGETHTYLNACTPACVYGLHLCLLVNQSGKKGKKDMSSHETSRTSVTSSCEKPSTCHHGPPPFSQPDFCSSG